MTAKLSKKRSKAQVLIEFDSKNNAAFYGMSPDDDFIVDPENLRIRLIVNPIQPGEMSVDDEDDNGFSWMFEYLGYDGLGEPQWRMVECNDDEIEQMKKFESLLMRAILAVLKKGDYAEK